MKTPPIKVSKKNSELKMSCLTQAIAVPRKIETNVAVRNEDLNSTTQFLSLLFSHKSFFFLFEICS